MRRALTREQEMLLFARMSPEARAAWEILSKGGKTYHASKSGDLTAFDDPMRWGGSLSLHTGPKRAAEDRARYVTGSRSSSRYIYEIENLEDLKPLFTTEAARWRRSNKQNPYWPTGRHAYTTLWDPYSGKYQRHAQYIGNQLTPFREHDWAEGQAIKMKGWPLATHRRWPGGRIRKSRFAPTMVGWNAQNLGSAHPVIAIRPNSYIYERLRRRGYQVIPYINAQEAPGQVSYIILDPTKVRIAKKLALYRHGERRREY